MKSAPFSNQFKVLMTGMILSAAFFIFPQNTQASFLYLSPSTTSVNQDSNFSLDVKLNTQEEVINGISAYLAFPTDKLEVISIDGNDQLLPIKAEESVDNNTIKISRANLSSVNGDLKVATLNFKAKALGSAQVSFIPGSAAPKTIDSSDSLSLENSKSATIQITNNPNSSPNPTTPKPSDRKVLRCIVTEQLNKNRFNLVIGALSDIKLRFDTIYALVDDFYNRQGKAIPNYLTQRPEVDAKRANAITQLEKLKTDSQNFSCNKPNPKDQLTQIRKQAQTTRSAFREYKQSVQKLIQILRRGR